MDIQDFRATISKGRFHYFYIRKELTMTLSSSHPLFIVEDSDEDFETWLWMLRHAGVTNEVTRCRDGDEALAALKQSANECMLTSPALIVLDLNLPGTDGREVLKQLKEDPELRLIPVIVWSTSTNPRDIELCYRYGANGYLNKPVDFALLKKTVNIFVTYWTELSLLPYPPSLKLPQG